MMCASQNWHNIFKHIKASILNEPKLAFDIILGNDIMDLAEFIINFETKEIQWHTFKKRHHWKSTKRIRTFNEYVKQPKRMKF